MIPADLLYTDQHTWVKREGKKIRFGITQNAVEELGEIVYVELPEVGAALAKGDSFAVVESTKAVYDLLAPASGKVTAVNGASADDPDSIAADPFGSGWMIEMSISDPSELDLLLSPADYEQKVKEG